MIKISVLLFTALSTVSAHLNAAEPVKCQQLLNQQDAKGNYEFWKKSGILKAVSDRSVHELRDLDDATRYIESLYLDAFLIQQDTGTFNFKKRCDSEIAALQTLNVASRTKFVTGSASGICLSILENWCKTKGMKMLDDATLALEKAQVAKKAFDGEAIAARDPERAVVLRSLDEAAALREQALEHSPVLVAMVKASGTKEPKTIMPMRTQVFQCVVLALSKLPPFNDTRKWKETTQETLKSCLKTYEGDDIKFLKELKKAAKYLEFKSLIDAVQNHKATRG